MSAKKIQIILIILLLAFIGLVYYFQRDPKAFIRPSQITSIYSDNIFVFNNINNNRETMVKIIGTDHEYSAQELSKLLTQANGIQLVTPRSQPFDEDKRVRAYVYLDGKQLK